MKPVFEENGLAAEPGEIRCYYYDAVTCEYMGWSDEYINIGVSMPGHSTDIDPGVVVAGEVAIFTGTGWKQEEDHRGEMVYSTKDGAASDIDYIGSVKDGYTSIAPLTLYDKWGGTKWVKDTDAERAADVAAAEAEKQSRIDQANDFMNRKQWPGKAVLGRLKGDELTQYNVWLDYWDVLEVVDTSRAPDIDWPIPPGELAS